jgi:hypothetical protein
MGIAKRPGGVTLVAVLTWISGLLDIIGGVLLLFQTSAAATVEAFGGSSQLIASAIGSILIGTLVVIVANGLLRGSAGARMVITVVQIISIAAAIFIAIAYPAGAIAEFFGAAVAVVVLALLWTGRASAFFRA